MSTKQDTTTPITPKRRQLSSGDVFEHNGHTFRIEIIQDDNQEQPWEAHDGHGVVGRAADMTGRSRLLYGRGSKLYYDQSATETRAMQEGWGLSDQDKDKLTIKLKHKPTQREIMLEAIEKDFEYLRSWCLGEWWWVGVKVVMVKVDQDADGGYFETKWQASLWGMESHAKEYLTDTAYELADEILSERNEGGK